MGLFSSLFKKKETVNTEVVNEVSEQSIVVSNSGIEQNDVGTVGESVGPVVVDENYADTDPSNVLERMQQNFVVESENEALEANNAANSDSIFNQKINLDESNPMSIFGVDSEENKK